MVDVKGLVLSDCGLCSHLVAASSPCPPVGVLGLFIGAASRLPYRKTREVKQIPRDPPDDITAIDGITCHRRQMLKPLRKARSARDMLTACAKYLGLLRPKKVIYYLKGRKKLDI